MNNDFNNYNQNNSNIGNNNVPNNQSLNNTTYNQPQVDNNIYQHQVNNTQQQLTEKELKKMRKEEKNKILKAREIIGTHYLITLILVNLPIFLIFNNYLKDNTILRIVLGYIWYIILPFLGAYLIKVMHFKKLSTYITKENYSKIKTYAIIDLAILGLFHVGVNLNIFVIPVIISFVLSVLYLIREMDKIYQSKQ